MKKSKFNLSHTNLLSGDFGWLYPILVEDCLPGDVWTCRSELYIKAIPLLSPQLTPVDVRVDYFFVPNRLLWESWPNFITGGNNGLNEQKAPWFTFNPAEVSTAQVYGKDKRFVVDKLYQLCFDDNWVDNASGDELIQLSAFPALAYDKIFRDWYYPENVHMTEDIDLNEFTGLTKDDVKLDGSLTSTGLTKVNSRLKLYQRAFAKDRLTAANQLPQRGPEVGFDIPPQDLEAVGVTSPNGRYVTRGTDQTVSTSVVSMSGGIMEGTTSVDIVHTHAQNYQRGELGTLTINEFRRLNALQRWFERNARWGARYIEQIMSHFGVRTPDYRLDRSEYLGGTVTPLNVSETYQSAAGSSTQETADVLGQYAGHMTSYGVNGMRKYRCDEHGWIIGLMSILPKVSYSQGLQKRFSRIDRLDFAFPEFAQLGDEAIYKKEVFIPSGYDFTEGDEVFGYTPRYSDYRSRQSRFDTNFLNVFPFWHLGQIYDAGPGQKPVLGSDFIYARDQDGTSQFDRIFAYTPVREEQSYNFHLFHFLCQCRNNVQVLRPLPKYVTPSL